MPLTPAGLLMSQPLDVEGNQQVGAASTAIGAAFHAILWFGSATNFVDLNPAGFSSSTAQSTNGQVQVGAASHGTPGDHAFARFGTRESALDLQHFVPSTFAYSEARAIDPSGVIVGSVYNNVWTGTARGDVDPGTRTEQRGLPCGAHGAVVLP